MKTKFSILMLALGILTVSTPALAREKVTAKELAQDDIAILPNNPFYFFVSFGRGIQELFITNTVNDAVFRLQVTGRRAAELQKLAAFSKKNSSLLTDSLAAYQQSVEELFEKLNSLTDADFVSKKARFTQEAFVSLINERLSLELQFIQDLREEEAFSTDQQWATLSVIEQILKDALTQLQNLTAEQI